MWTVAACIVVCVFVGAAVETMFIRHWESKQRRAEQAYRLKWGPKERDYEALDRGYRASQQVPTREEWLARQAEANLPTLS